jgi:glycosyltransferase involved in cell wall biosynthesis
MPGRALRIAWLGAGPAWGESAGVPGVATELLDGLASLGHRIDCFLPTAGRKLPERLLENGNLSFVFGTSSWRWDRWYVRSRFTAGITGLLSRTLAAIRLRREIVRRHRRDPYDVIYQFSSIESVSMPKGLLGSVPLVIHPETHAAGELRFLLSERRLALRSESTLRYLATLAITAVRSRLQRRRIQEASLLVCISGVFRDHLLRDYRFPAERAVVIPNPIRLGRFERLEARPREHPTVLVLGRVAVRKGIDTVISVARALGEQQAGVRLRVAGGPGLWSDYTKLLVDLPTHIAEYVGKIPPADLPAELARTDVLLQASKYEPFALTVAEALAAGVPVVATSEVGAIEGVDREVVIETEPDDAAALTAAVLEMVSRVRARPEQLRALAKAEAARLFAPEVVCLQVAGALERLLA